MEPKITRRTFLFSFVPSWLTQRNLRFAGIAALGALLATVVVSIFQHLDFLSLLKLAGVALGVVFALALITWLGSALIALTEKSPPWVSALLSVLWKVVEFAAAGAFGVHLYRRWQRGEDLTSALLTVAVVTYYQFRAEWEKRSTAKLLPK